MRRREFITLLGGAARGRSRRARSSPSKCGGSACWWPSPRTIRKSRRGLRDSGRASKDLDGRRTQCPRRYSLCARRHQAQGLAKELIALQPDVILAQGTPVVAALQRESRTIPIVFIGNADPIGSGFVASLRATGR